MLGFHSQHEGKKQNKTKQLNGTESSVLKDQYPILSTENKNRHQGVSKEKEWEQWNLQSNILTSSNF